MDKPYGLSLYKGRQPLAQKRESVRAKPSSERPDTDVSKMVRKVDSSGVWWVGRPMILGVMVLLLVLVIPTVKGEVLCYTCQECDEHDVMQTEQCSVECGIWYSCKWKAGPVADEIPLKCSLFFSERWRASSKPWMHRASAER